jgi:hypothetical protein
MTDHCFDVTTLERMGRDVRLGKIPGLDDETKARLLPKVQRAKAMLGLEREMEKAAKLDRLSPQPARWWRFWQRQYDPGKSPR